MLFRDVPESQFLTKNSRFVYSEDDEHLKYIRHMNFLKNRPRLFKNKYGINPPNKPIGADLYDTMYYHYTDDIYDTTLYAGSFPDDDAWVSDSYMKYHDYRVYPLVNNKVNFKTYWAKPISYYDEDANRVSIVNETHQDYIDQVPPPADWSENVYTYVRAHNTSSIETYALRYRLEPGSVEHYFFPVNDNTSYEIRFKVRLHNLINEEGIEYYPKSEYLISTTKPGHPTGEIGQPIKHTATYVNGISINFNNRPFTGGLSVSGYDGRVASGLQYYAGLREHYDRVGPNEYVRNDTNVEYVYQYLYPASVTPPLILGFNSHRNGEPSMYTISRKWGLKWATLPRWEVLSIKDALSMTEEEVIETDGAMGGSYSLYESYFVRFGFDNDWHEFVIPLNNFDDYYNHQALTHLTPSIAILLSGLRPTTANDSYVEIKDFEILSVPIRYKESKIYTQIDHIYLNKNGIWLPDDFTKESEFASFSRIRSTGQKIAECEFQGVSSEVYAPPLVDSVSITTNYNDGTKIMDFKIDGVSHPVYYPIKTISDAKIIEQVSPSLQPFEFNIMENNVIKIKHNRKRCGIRRNDDGELYYKFDEFDTERSFGLANLNDTYQASIIDGDSRGGYWICNAEIDICTDTGYTPDSNDEYLSFAVSGGLNGIFFNNVNFPLEKRIPLSIFGGQPINHYKINIPFIYRNTSSNYFSMNVIFKGKLKTGATLTTSDNLTVTLKARRIIESGG